MVTITVGELRSLVDEILDEKLRRLGAGRNNGLLTVEQAAEFLGYGKDWLYKNWRKIGGKGVRFDAADLESWIKSRGS